MEEHHTFRSMRNICDGRSVSTSKAPLPPSMFELLTPQSGICIFACKLMSKLQIFMRVWGAVLSVRTNWFYEEFKW